MYEGPEQRKDMGDMFHGLRQLARYGLVGLLNVAIDFTLTNTLVILTGASSSAALFAISLTACLVATLNGYRINKTWTFGFSDTPLPHSAMVKYVGVAVLAMLVNTSVFLFSYQFLLDEFDVSRLVGINIAKLFGVATASIFAFLGYRVSVFRPAVVEDFREHFRFNEAKTWGVSLTTQLVVLVLISASMCAVFLSLTTTVYGNAVNFGLTAEAISKGDWHRAQAGWVNLFCFWEALFYLLGFSQIQSAIAASLIPGIFLVVPVVYAARLFYGEKVAWLAGALTALHPRLVSYSCNGYTETFYLLALAAGVAFLARSGWKACSKLILLAAGLSFGFYFCIRNEGIIHLAVLLIGLLVLARRTKRMGFTCRSPWVTNPFRALTIVLCGFFLVAAGYGTTSKMLFGDIGLFQTSSAFTQRYSTQFDPQSAAREVYGFEGRMVTGKEAQAGIAKKMQMWIARLPANLLYMLKSTPGVLLTPFWFFAFFLPLFARSVDETLLPEWPWLVMLLFPILAYPLLYVEPRLLFATLLPIHLFGAAGLLAFSCFLEKNNYLSGLYPVVGTLVLAVCILLTVFRGLQIEGTYGYNRPLAAWITSNIPVGDVIVGDGYGFVATTGFLARRQTINRLIHYDPNKIVDFVKSRHSRWLILYEPFVVKVNPELFPVLERGLPGMELAFQARDDHNRRIQVYRLKDKGRQVFEREADPALKPSLK